MTPTPGGRRPKLSAAGSATREDEEPQTRGSLALEGSGGLLARARRGEAAARETLLGRYTPFALKVASQVSGGYVELGNHDEASVALMAFNEAIDSYDPARGASFLGFARGVIRRRLIDLYRRNSSVREVPVGTLAEAEMGPSGDDRDSGRPRLEKAQVEQAERIHRAREEADDRREEVFRYREALAVYGISLAELARLSPRHEDARRRAMEVAGVLASRPEMTEHLRRTGELPLKDLNSLTKVSRKTIERQRKYIIAVFVILTEDLPHLREYLK